MRDHDEDVEQITRAVRRRLERWRRTRRGKCIPERIWAEAVALALHQGVFKTARALGLNYGSLKRRIEDRGELAPTPAPAPTLGAEQPLTFVELLAPLSGNVSGCRLELETTRGARLRVELGSVTPQGLATILRELAS